MNKALAFLLCLSIPVSCAAEKSELDLRLDPKAGLPQQTLHFTVEAYGTTATNKARLLENTYLGFIDATGLSSFAMPQKIRVLIFEDKREFQAKLEGSRKNAVTGAHTLATYEQPNLDRILVSNVSNMMLEAYFGRKFDKEEIWVRQGVVGTVVVIVGDEDRGEVRERWRAYLKRAGPVSLDQLTGKDRVTSDEEPTAQTAFEKQRNNWKDRSSRRVQMTAGSLVLFLRDWGGQLNFAYFLAQLRAKRSLDDAVAFAYPGKFRNLSELYNFWLHEDVGELKKPAPNQR